MDGMNAVCARRSSALFALVAALSGCDDAAEVQGDDYAPSDEKGDIFSGDNSVERHELEISDPRYEFARASAALIKTDKISLTPQGWALQGQTLGEKRRLCDDEAFREQPAVASCSGTLIGEDLVLTAGHCLTKFTGTAESVPAVQEACDATKVAFDFAYETEGSRLVSLPEEKVYQCTRVLERELHFLLNGDLIDYGIIKLDRPVTDRAPMKLRDGAPMESGADVTIAGHPEGIPQKISDSKVADSLECTRLGHNAGTSVISSGSGIFDPVTNAVAGIHSQGVTAQTYGLNEERGCHAANVCGEGGVECRSSAVAYDVSGMLSLIPEDVKEKLRIVEAVRPSACGAPDGGDSDD